MKSELVTKICFGRTVPNIVRKEAFGLSPTLIGMEKFTQCEQTGLMTWLGGLV